VGQSVIVLGDVSLEFFVVLEGEVGVCVEAHRNAENSLKNEAASDIADKLRNQQKSATYSHDDLRNCLAAWAREAPLEDSEEEMIKNWDYSK